MKKILSLILIAACILTMCACGSSEEPHTVTEADTKESETKKAVNADLMALFEAYMKEHEPGYKNRLEDDGLFCITLDGKTRFELRAKSRGDFAVVCGYTGSVMDFVQEQGLTLGEVTIMANRDTLSEDGLVWNSTNGKTGLLSDFSIENTVDGAAVDVPWGKMAKYIEMSTGRNLYSKGEGKKPSGGQDTAKGRRDESLKGRGMADTGRNEPDYVGVIGYVVISSSQEVDIEKLDTFTDESLWVIPTYKQDKQYWVETGKTVPHKTEVVVKEQMLEHQGYGSYSGYLYVEETATGSQYYIDVKTYVTQPYWTYDDLTKAALVGDYVAEYHQKSDYYPMTSSGDKADLEDGMIVLVTGKGTPKGYSDTQVSVQALAWKEWRLGYGGVDVYFNPADLTIKY